METLFDYRNHGSLQQRGFTFVDNNVASEIHTTISITASLQNNNTKIVCGSALEQRGRSATANLLVAGKQLWSSECAAPIKLVVQVLLAVIKIQSSSGN